MSDSKTCPKCQCSRTQRVEPCTCSCHSPYSGDTCPCCGSPVEVVTSDEGTSYYRAISHVPDEVVGAWEWIRPSLTDPEWTDSHASIDRFIQRGVDFWEQSAPTGLTTGLTSTATSEEASE